MNEVNICGLHFKNNTEISNPKYVQVGARSHHFNCRLKKKNHTHILGGMPPDPPSFQAFLIFVTGTPGHNYAEERYHGFTCSVKHTQRLLVVVSVVMNHVRDLILIIILDVSLVQFMYPVY